MGEASRKRYLRLESFNRTLPDAEIRARAEHSVNEARRLHYMLRDMLDAEIARPGVLGELLQAAYQRHGFRINIEVVDKTALALPETDKPTIISASS